jgi:competence protein ComEC
MLRAGIVTGLSLLAWYYGRRFLPLLLLGIVAAITAVYNPHYVWGDVGWYLSFLAFFGVLVLAPLITKYYFADRPNTNAMRSAFIESVSAIVMTAPYMLYVFGQFSTVAVLANVLVVPMIPFAMVATFLAGMVTAFLPFIGSIVAFPARIILEVILWVIETLARRDPGITTEQFPLWAVLLLYTIIVLFSLHIHRKTRTVYFEDENPLDDMHRQSHY